MISYKIVVCASCGGGLFKALLDNCTIVGYQITRLIVDRECGAIEVAERYGVHVVKIPNNNNLVNEFIKEVPIDTDLIVLAGYLPILPREICERYHQKMINIHPSLLPLYGGKGMYGVKVQEAVMANREKYGGCTIHFVSEDIDAGQIILQERIEVDYNMSPWQFGGKVFDLSTSALIKAIRILMKNE